MTRIFNEFKSRYRPVNSRLSIEVYNKLTKELTKDMEDPSFNIYMLDCRGLEDQDTARCPLWYADQEIGFVYIDNKSSIIKDIIIKAWYKHRFSNCDSITEKYIGVKVCDSRYQEVKTEYYL